MFPDVEALHSLATTYRRRAETIRVAAADVVRDAYATPWHGLAADAARDAAIGAALVLRQRADDHDAVAGDLVRHAEAVAATVASIVAIRDRFLEIARSVGAVVTEVAEFAGDSIEALGGALDAASGAVGGIAGEAIGAVGDGLSSLAGGADDALRERIERMTLPPAGDIGWLQVDVENL